MGIEQMVIQEGKNTIFAGTAKYYAKYRPNIPVEVVTTLGKNIISMVVAYLWILVAALEFLLEPLPHCLKNHCL